MELVATSPLAGYLDAAPLVESDDPAGYVIRALNAVHLGGAWHRLDARGNKPGVSAEFSLSVERLAFPIRARYDEIDPVAR